MKTSSLLIAAIVLLLATAIFITPGYTRGWFEPAHPRQIHRLLPQTTIT